MYLYAYQTCTITTTTTACLRNVGLLCKLVVILVQSTLAYSMSRYATDAIWHVGQ